MRSIVLASALTLATAAAQTSAPPLNELLRDGLFAEEVSQDSEGAARSYNQVLSRAAADEPFIANALFRLAEIRRKQDRKEDAVKYYQQFLSHYPDMEPQAKLSRDALATLGVAATPENPQPGSDAEANELQRLTGVLKTSPDLLKPMAELPKAASNGWKRVTRFLLDHLEGKEKQDGLNAALAAAASSGQLEMCRSLLEEKADPNGLEGGAILNDAVRADRREVVKLLLSKGANPNAAPERCFVPNWRQENQSTEPVGAALHTAIFTGNRWLAEALLKAGADPSLPAPGSLYTPLHIALAMNRTNATTLSWVKLLLESGAKADATIHYPGGNGSPESFVTPLNLAAKDGNTEVCKLLLEAGAKPHGSDELSGAISSTQIDLIKLLLAHGADAKAPPPNTNSSRDQNSLLSQAARGQNPEIFHLILESGAPIDPIWKAVGFDNTSDAIRLELFKKTIFPAWTEAGDIRFVANPSEQVSRNVINPTGNSVQMRTPLLATRSTGEAPPPLAEALASFRSFSFGSLITGVILYRRNTSGDYEALEIPVENQAPYPELQWGDILWAKTSPNSGKPTEWSAEIQSSLLQHISVPITVAFNGRTEAITLRGDCLSYDPTKPVAPFLKAGPLVRLLTGRSAGTFNIVSKGWPQPIRLDIANKDADSFKLKAGDTLTIDPPPADDPERKESIFITSPGVWFTKSFGADNISSPPTLLQAIAAIYDMELPVTSFRYPEDLPKSNQSGWPEFLKLLPHPDLSLIRIHRLTDSGETILEVDLEKAAADCHPDTTAEEARKADRDLMAGDIVEIPMMPGKKDTPWTGFNENEARLLSKALSCQVEVSDPEGLTLKPLLYSPPRVIGTKAGPFAFPETAGTSLPHAMKLPNRTTGFPVNDRIALKRGDQTGEKARVATFLRDGDRVEFGKSYGSQRAEPLPAQPGNPEGSRAPRSRVLPPTQSR